MTYNAVAHRVDLEITVPYPEDVRRAVEAARSVVASLAAEHPFLWAHFDVASVPSVKVFSESLDSVAIRDEFRRKAKKLGVGFKEVNFGFLAYEEPDRLRFVAEAQRKFA